MSKRDSQPVAVVRILCFIFSLLWILLPSQLHAATINVGPDQTHKRIQDALNDAQTGDTVFVETGTYAENVVLQNGITIEGEETARTKIVGTGISGDTITIIGNSTIMNMTIINTVTGSAAIAISSNVTGARVTNNLIVDSDTGIQCATSSNLTITNNTIDGNTTGITCTGPTTMTFENNIVSNNTTTGINFLASVTGAIDFNDVYNNGSNSYTPGTNDLNRDPKFVNPTSNDYHLQAGSACLDTGDPNPSFNDKEVLTSSVDHSQNDCGGYGGPQKDTTPFQAQNVVPTPGTDTIVLKWDANLAYNIVKYKIYFDNRNHNIINNVPSPPYKNNLTVAATTANCPSAPIPPACTTTLPLTFTAPANLHVNFGDQKLFLDWDAPSTNANSVTGYNVYYKEDTASAWITVPLGNINSYTLTGLTNFITYNIRVTAVALPTYFINVTALDDYTTPHESNLLISDVSTTITCSAPSCESPSSNEVSDTPEPIAPFPDLPDQGHCFIATSAYGSPWEPQVKVLRVFRDEYLKPYDWGRRFIAWYYHLSPPWAQYLNEHVWLKPMVRATLVPAVGVASFFLVTTEVERFSIFLLVVLCLLGGVLVLKKTRRSRR